MIRDRARNARQWMSSRFAERIEKLMGQALSERDFGFLRTDLPLSELERLKAFMAHDSNTLNRAGVARAQAMVAENLEELGFQVEEIPGDPRFAPLVLAERPGHGANGTRFITLITHTDTVLPRDGEFALDLQNGQAFGSGAIDNKGGVVVGLSGLTRFLGPHPRTEYGLRFICSPNEELGSIGFTSLFQEMAKDTVVAFGLEPALDNGSIVHQRRGNRWYEISIQGREAHAGRSYGQHANAAHDLAAKIVNLAALTNYRRHISLNVGHIDAGKDKFNIVCGFANVKLDVRFPSFEARDHLHWKIDRILMRPAEVSVDGRFRTETQYKIVDDCPPFTLTRRSKRLARSYAALISQLEGKKVYSQPAGGAGDVNYLSTDKNFVLDGLGPVGGQMHTTNEFVYIETLKTRAQALAGFLFHLQTHKLESS